MNQLHIGAWAMIHWIYNTSGERFAETAYGKDQFRGYLMEKAAIWAKSPVRALGFLGPEQRARVLEAAMASYEMQAIRDLG
jgi:hypothetical protein